MAETPLSPSSPSPAARLRSGTAARLAGVPVTTLRVWERRYGVVAAPKTPTGQRLYSSLDVQRLKLLKQLTDRGLAIGTIAGLPLAALQGLAEQTVNAAARPTLVVVGRAMALRLQGSARAELLRTHDDLDAAEVHEAPEGPLDVLLVHLPSLQPAFADRVLSLATRLQAASLVVVYAFGAEPVAEGLRAAGATVRREPATGRDIARLVSTPPPPAAHAAWRIAPRRYSDEALTHVAELPTAVACECPRHIAEIVLQLSGFERYSADCQSESPADAALHRRLTGLAAAARTMFERALTDVVAREGLVLPP